MAARKTPEAWPLERSATGSCWQPRRPHRTSSSFRPPAPSTCKKPRNAWNQASAPWWEWCARKRKTPPTPTSASWSPASPTPTTSRSGCYLTSLNLSGTRKLNDLSW